MKYLITESQLDKIILGYLDSQGFKKVLRRKIIFFTTNPELGTSDIVYYKNKGKLYITHELCWSVTKVFSLEDSDDCLIIIKRWVEDEIKEQINIEEVYKYRKESTFGDLIFKIPEE